jgi:hypothetical protein
VGWLGAIKYIAIGGKEYRTNVDESKGKTYHFSYGAKVHVQYFNSRKVNSFMVIFII